MSGPILWYSRQRPAKVLVILLHALVTMIISMVVFKYQISTLYNFYICITLTQYIYRNIFCFISYSYSVLTAVAPMFHVWD